MLVFLQLELHEGDEVYNKWGKNSTAIEPHLSSHLKEEHSYKDIQIVLLSH
jgi:hypothetical protein